MFAARLCAEFRQKFATDVVLDIVCYRRYGHNETRRAGLHPADHVQAASARCGPRAPSTPSGWPSEGSVPAEESKAILDAFNATAGGGLPGVAVLQAEQGGLAGRALVRAEGRRRRRRTRSGCTRRRCRSRRCARSATRWPACRRASTSTRRSPGSSKPSGRRSRAAKASTGRPARRSASARCCWKGTACASRARTCSAAPSASATPCWWTSRPRPSTCRSTTSATGQARFEVFNSLLSEFGVLGLRVRLLARRSAHAGAVGGAVRRLRQRRAGDHRPVHRLAARPSGCACRASCCCCRTATRGRGRSTPRRGWSASCSSAPSGTCGSATSPRRPTTSTRCAASSRRTTASRWC